MSRLRHLIKYGGNTISLGTVVTGAATSAAATAAADDPNIGVTGNEVITVDQPLDGLFFEVSESVATSWAFS